MAEENKVAKSDDKPVIKNALEDIQSGLPKVLSGDGENPNAHVLPAAAKKYAGKYKLTHGSVRIGDFFYGPGAIMQMSADDGKRMSDAGTAERLDE